MLGGRDVDEEVAPVCDYCDCRTRPLLAHLGADHERILTGVHGLRTATDSGDADRRMVLAGELVDVLEEHGRLEEAALYPELALAGVPTDAMEAEHEDVDAVLRRAAGAPEVDPVELATALRRLEAHIHREEYDLFPAAHQVLDDAAWDRIHLELERSS